MKTLKFCLITFIILVLIADCVYLGYAFSKPDLNKLNNIYSEYELNMLHTKSELVTEISNYISKNAPGSDLSSLLLVNYCDEYEVDIKFVLVQGLQESHFGTKGLAQRTNSVWNVYAYDGYTYDKIPKCGKYRHPNESIEPYLKLLKTRYLVDKTELNLLQSFIDLDGARYASYKLYEKELSQKYDNLSGTKLDSLLQTYNRQKLILNR